MINKVTLDIKEKEKVTLEFDGQVYGKNGSAVDYNKLSNKPQINGVTLQGNKTFPDLKMEAMSVTDIEKILYLD